MTLGKHVYTEKPLTHTIYESRLLAKLATKYGVATQMGNQGSSNDGVRKACAWAWAGEIGDVVRAEAWTSRPMWPQGIDAPTDVQKVPKTLDWNLFIAHAPFRPYNSAYHPMEPSWLWWISELVLWVIWHAIIMHPVFKVLKLG